MQDEEFPFSLQDITNLNRAYSHEEVTVGTGSGSDDVVIRGFSLSARINGGACFWNKLRFGKWSRRVEMWLDLDRRSERRKRCNYDDDLINEDIDREIESAKTAHRKARTAADKQLIGDSLRFYRYIVMTYKWQRKQDEEVRYRQQKIKNETRIAENRKVSKWWPYISACSQLTANQSITFAVENDAKSFAVNLRANLSSSRVTYLMRFSVKSSEHQITVSLVDVYGGSVVETRSADAAYKSEVNIANRQGRGTRGGGGGGKKKIRKVQRQRPAGWHGYRPDHDVEKRWNRDTLDSASTQD